MIGFGIFAPAGFATDPASVDRAVARLTSLGHRQFPQQRRVRVVLVE